MYFHVMKNVYKDINYKNSLPHFIRLYLILHYIVILDIYLVVHEAHQIFNIVDFVFERAKYHIKFYEKLQFLFNEGIDEEAILLLTPEYVAKLIKGMYNTPNI
ncbi:hypothetical protein Avbf_13311 [Armadillidium vulgare]|nr:hypothetical protein Avbf_13311 [Armadillidium vulgare]